MKPHGFLKPMKPCLIFTSLVFTVKSMETKILSTLQTKAPEIYAQTNAYLSEQQQLHATSGTFQTLLAD